MPARAKSTPVRAQISNTMDNAILLIVLAAVLGLVVGSMVNAFVLRAKNGLRLMSSNKCIRCVEPIAWYDAIPVLSYFALRGRCRRCTAAIEWQYPAVEAAMAVLFALFAARVVFAIGIPSFVDVHETWMLFVRDAAMSALLVIIFLYDFRFSVIPDRFSIPAIVVAVLMNIALGANPWSMLVGGLVLGAFFSVQFLVSGGKWIGGGDIRMGLMMGFLLGLPLGMLALFIAYVGGAIAGVILLAGKHRTLSSHVPFGTFLAGGTIIALVAGPAILSWYVGLFS